MLKGYDSWLYQQADSYMESFCDGEPKVIGAYQEFEGYDENGRMETSTSYTYNCEDCEEKDCEHWKDFHEVEESED